MLVPCCCRDKWPETFQLQTIQPFYLRALEVRRLACHWADFTVSAELEFSESPGENLFPWLFQLPEVPTFLAPSVPSSKAVMLNPSNCSSIVIAPSDHSQKGSSLVRTVMTSLSPPYHLESSHFKAIGLVTFIGSETLVPFCHARWHTDRFQGSEREHIEGNIILATVLYPFHPTRYHCCKVVHVWHRCIPSTIIHKHITHLVGINGLIQ